MTVAYTSRLKEQLEKMPAVRLQLSDGTTYQSEGEIDAVSGVIDQSTGSVSMRAVFPNDKNILRSGGTGNIIFPYTMHAQRAAQMDFI